MFYERLVTLCAAKGTNPTALCDALGLAQSAATRWKQGSVPRDTTMKKIADYFGTSVSYLSGLTDNPDPIALIDPSKKEPPMLEQLNNIMKDMTIEELEELNRYVDYLVNRKNK